MQARRRTLRVAFVISPSSSGVVGERVDWEGHLHVAQTRVSPLLRGRSMPWICAGTQTLTGIANGAMCGERDVQLCQAPRARERGLASARGGGFARFALFLEVHTAPLCSNTLWPRGAGVCATTDKGGRWRREMNAGGSTGTRADAARVAVEPRPHRGAAAPGTVRPTAVDPFIVIVIGRARGSGRGVEGRDVGEASSFP